MLPIPIPGFADPVSSWSHLLGAVAAFVGMIALIRKGHGNAGRLFSLVLFSFTLMFLFSMSGVFHLLDRGGVARDVLQRLDHAGIWALIAGTFTPIHAILFRGPWRWAVLLVVWTIAITGLVLEVVFFTHFPEWLLLSFFLGLGWVGALTGFQFRRTFGHESLKLLAAGGIFYSIGAVIDFAKWPDPWPGVIGPHEIFHFWVLLGAASHWLFVYRWSDHPVANVITFNVRIFPTSHFIARAIGERCEVEADSLEELKARIRATVKARFHDSITPKIHLRYFQEETL